MARDGTEYGARGRWYDGNLVRFYGNNVGPIGGWKVRGDVVDGEPTDIVSGAARSIIAWRDNSNARRIVVGTHSGLYHQSAIAAVLDITPVGYAVGDVNGGTRSGYGEGAFGSGAFGVARPDTGDSNDATRWALDTFGQLPVACTATDGTIYSWDLNSSNVAEPVTNAPTLCQGIAVTEQRALMAFGAGGDTRNVAWSDLENMTDWTPTAENQAGDFNLSTHGSIVLGLRVGPKMLILTTVDAHVASYVRPPFVYGFQRVGQGCGAISSGCAVVAGQFAFWWGRSGFWRYDGGSVVPLKCDVLDFITRDLNRGQKSKISAYHNSRFGEVTWLYPSSTSVENDSYVTHSYRDGWWVTGEMVRGCGVEEGAFIYPLLVSIDDADAGLKSGAIYEHERGYEYDDAVPWVETGPLGNESWPPQFVSGDRVMKINGVIGDEQTVGKVSVGFKTRNFPNSPETTIAQKTLTARGEADFRFSGRQVRMRIEGVASTNWRFGTARLRAEVGGGR